MKRVGNLYEKICNIDNIKLAIRKSAKDKTIKNYVVKVLKNIDYYAYTIQCMLINHSYTLGNNNHRIIKEGSNRKERDITIPKYYPDQIIHWCLMIILQPIIMKSMYEFCCGSIPNRGIIYVKKYIEKIYKKDKKVKYCLKLDIKKYYPSVNNTILFNFIKRKIKCKDTLLLIKDILISGGQGLPIGFYTSQWFSNFLFRIIRSLY